MDSKRFPRIVWLWVVWGLMVAAVAAPAQTWSERQVRVTLLQLNDVYQPTPMDKGKTAGLARVATLRKRILQESPNTLFLLGGDTISPSVASSIFRGAQMIASWNAIGLDYAVLGNHEFDFGPEVLTERMKESQFVWLGANVIDRRNNQPFQGMPPFVVRTFEGVKVGIIGLLTPETATSSKPGPDVRLVDPMATAKRLVKRLREDGVRVIIAVTHLSMNEDKELARSGLVDVILGGHDHEMMQSLAGHTPIFKWGSDARQLGRIDLNLLVSTGRIASIDWSAIPVTDAIPDDPEAAAVIAEFETKLSAELGKPIGQSAVDLDARQVSSRNTETNVGNLIADAFRAATGADIAIVNGGSIRSNTLYPAGPLTKRDIIAILPFENPVVKIEVSGAIVKAALENGVSRIAEDRESGRFPQVSGLEFEFDGRRPSGSRVVSVKINGQPLDEQKTYSLASSIYLIEGGDGYKMFQNPKFLITEEAAQVDAAMVGDFIAGKGEIAPRVEGRIRRLDQ